MEYDLNNLKLLAQGGEAEIYDLRTGKILRVLRNPSNGKDIKNEMRIMNKLKIEGFKVPEVYEYLTVEGRPAIIMERVYGETMLSYIQSHPLAIKKSAKVLAKLHDELINAKEDLELNYSISRAKYLIERSKLLNDKQKEFVNSILEELHEGEVICHGDFHPGNILIQDNKNYLIDWGSAYRGPALADIAHSYLLMKNTPRIPGIGIMQYNVMRIGGGVLAKTYINEMHRLQSFDWGELSKWIVVKAAERTFHGLTMEKTKLVQHIEYCMRENASGVPSYRWYLEL